MPLSENGEPVAVPGQQRLIGGHDRFAGGERDFDHTLGGIALPADHFDHHVDRRIGGKFRRIGKPAKFLQIDAALFAARARTYGNDLDRAAAARDQLFALAVQELNHSRADRSQSGKTDFQRFGHKPANLTWKSARIG